MHGSVGLQKNESKWRFLGLGLSRVADVKVGDDSFRLHCLREMFSFTIRYELIDMNGVALQSASLALKNSEYSMDLSFGVGFVLNYKSTVCGKAIFATDDEETPSYLNLSDNKRVLNIGEMRFEHLDYQSKIQFVCDKKQLYQAIFIANLLFNQPLSEQEG